MDGWGFFIEGGERFLKTESIFEEKGMIFDESGEQGFLFLYNNFGYYLIVFRLFL